MLSNVKRTYALGDFTVEGPADKWFYWRTARYGDKEERRGPYSSIASVTLMIARELIHFSTFVSLPEAIASIRRSRNTLRYDA